MKIVITNESGDWKEMLYTKDKLTFEVNDPEIIDFFGKLNEAYNDDEVIDDMYECLYNLINFGYLYGDDDDDYDNFDEKDYDDDDDDLDDFDDEEDYDDDLDDDFDSDDYDDCDEIETQGMCMIESTVEYYVDDQQVTKAEYDNAWDLKIGYLGSSNWEEKGLCIKNADTGEVIFIGKI